MLMVALPPPVTADSVVTYHVLQANDETDVPPVVNHCGVDEIAPACGANAAARVNAPPISTAASIAFVTRATRPAPGRKPPITPSSSVVLPESPLRRCLRCGAASQPLRMPFPCPARPARAFPYEPAACTVRLREAVATFFVGNVWSFTFTLIV